MVVSQEPALLFQMDQGGHFSRGLGPRSGRAPQGAILERPQLFPKTPAWYPHLGVCVGGGTVPMSAREAVTALPFLGQDVRA